MNAIERELPGWIHRRLAQRAQVNPHGTGSDMRAMRGGRVSRW
jgi:hypothetical protein